MNRADKLNRIAKTLCGIDSITDCPHRDATTCKKYGYCRLNEKTDEQLDYILSPINECIYLEACAGSGKTEVLGMKAAYELCHWNSHNTGIAVLTFTNEATSTIADRISRFYHRPLPSKHFVGTFSSFVHGYIAQRFGYKLYRSQVDVKDKSFRIVDSDIDQYNNHWLQNYALDFPISKTTNLFANQLNYRAGAGDWFIGKGEKSVSLHECYMSSEAQRYIAELRNRKKNPHLFEYDYLCEQVKECKLKFWKAGFATFEDMNLIARKCLMDREVSSQLSKKFPLIMVDECQDLSKNELWILSLLIEAGSKVHFIGDLHQSIYSFKDSLPKYFNEYVEKYKLNVMQLTDNFRSTQKIVDVSRILGSIHAPLTGTVKSKFNDQDCYYFEYDNEANAISTFQSMLENREIPFNDSIILVRTQATKAKISTSTSDSYRKHAIINSIQLWKFDSPNSKINALKLMGWQLQQWFDFQGRSNNFYFSNEFRCNAVVWRLMLRDILSNLCQDTVISDFEKLSYSKWYSKNKRRIVEIINSHTSPTIGKVLNPTANFIKTPRGTATLKTEKLALDEKKLIRVETIHSVKGASFDAVLLLSTPNARGKTGYWENWLIPEDEASRISYVACTRPRFLLCWGVHSLTDDQRRKIEEIGFIKYNENIASR